ncbi:MAG: hypothetical protein H7123_08540, partial [Thermoleophilia bacterium]|nr:hypothetical protein [Thermoleophilia bacterium]
MSRRTTNIQLAERTELQRAYRYHVRLVAPVLTGIASVVVWMVLGNQPLAAFAIGLDLILVALFLSLRANIVAHGQMRVLQHAARQLEEAERIAHVGSWEWYVDSGAMTWSDEMCRLCNCDPESGKVSFDLLMGRVRGPHRERVTEVIKRAVRHDDSYDIDMPIVQPDGTGGVLRAQGDMTIDVRGIRCMVGVIQDVTELRSSQAMQREFVATSSHELHAPTPVITGFAETLHSRRDELDEQCRRRAPEDICLTGNRRVMSRVPGSAGKLGAHGVNMQGVKVTYRNRFTPVTAGLQLVDLSPIARMYLYRVRPWVTVAAGIAFVLCWLVIGDQQLADVAIGLGVSTFASLMYIAVARRGNELRVLRVSIFVDAVIIAGLVSRMDHPEVFATAYIWSLLLGGLFLTLRQNLAVFGLVVALTMVVPVLASPSPDYVTMVTHAIIFGCVVFSLSAVRSEEANLRLRLLLSTRLLEEAQRVAHIGSWEWQPESGLWALSDEMYRLLGLEPRDPQLTIDYFLGLIREQYRAEVTRALELAMAENVPYDLDYPISLGDGERRIIRAQGAQVLDACGVRWLVGTAQDVTDLRKADALKDDFVATASHELRTPTTVIAGFAGILHSQWDQLDDHARREIVGRINGASIRLTRLISDVLYISQIESRHICLSPVEFSMSGLLHETVADLDSDRVQLSIADGADKLLAFADPSRQRQVLDNLLSNALRYSPDDE